MIEVEEQVEEIVLTLSKNEAKVLASLTGNVLGKGLIRRIVDDMYKILEPYDTGYRSIFSNELKITEGAEKSLEE